MLTQFFRSINWVDVFLFVLFVRTVFLSVKTGVVAEISRFLGLIVALFLGLHYYAVATEVLAKKVPIPPANLKLLVYVGIVAGVILAFKFLHDGAKLLFQTETSHQGFDKYGGGVLGAIRAWLLCSTVLFAFLLVPNAWVHRQAVSGWVHHPVVAKAAPRVYDVLFKRVIFKLFDGQRFNSEVFAVVSGESKVKAK